MCNPSMLNEYKVARSRILNEHNGHVKLGCVAFSPKLKHQCVLCVWV